ncbi:hypothetical protein ACIOJE_37740 [Kitasatospora sp. NPDC087861]|uniref:hypothetical protein n=1 Tax=Kitasatospora sp. NPDC087861 TaxID=3364070 RepID=UPI0038124807
MDTDIKAMADAVREARTRIREDALPRARARRDDVPEGDEAALLGALAALVDTVAELAVTIHMRMASPDTRTAYWRADQRLREQAENLREDERKVAAKAEESARQKEARQKGLPTEKQPPRTP